MQNKAVRELFEKHMALEAAFVEMAQEVIRTAPWGLMWRVGLGAMLSVVDIITDINVTLSFRNNEKQAVYYIAMLISLGCSLVFQLFFTIIQNKGRSASALLTEMMWAVIFLKSPRDAYKVRAAKDCGCCGDKCRKRIKIC